jgi:hypothetical protein
MGRQASNPHLPEQVTPGHHEYHPTPESSHISTVARTAASCTTFAQALPLDRRCRHAAPTRPSHLWPSCTLHRLAPATSTPPTHTHPCRRLCHRSAVRQRRQLWRCQHTMLSIQHKALADEGLIRAAVDLDDASCDAVRNVARCEERGVGAFWCGDRGQSWCGEGRATEPACGDTAGTQRAARGDFLIVPASMRKRASAPGAHKDNSHNLQQRPQDRSKHRPVCKCDRLASSCGEIVAMIDIRMSSGSWTCK